MTEACLVLLLYDANFWQVYSLFECMGVSCLWETSDWRQAQIEMYKSWANLSLLILKLVLLDCQLWLQWYSEKVNRKRVNIDENIEQGVNLESFFYKHWKHKSIKKVEFEGSLIFSSESVLDA